MFLPHTNPHSDSLKATFLNISAPWFSSPAWKPYHVSLCRAFHELLCNSSDSSPCPLYPKVEKPSLNKNLVYWGPDTFENIYSLLVLFLPHTYTHAHTMGWPVLFFSLAAKKCINLVLIHEATVIALFLLFEKAKFCDSYITLI